MQIKSTDLVLTMNKLNREMKKLDQVKLRLSRKAQELYYRLSIEGFFSNFLMAREYKTGLVHLVKVR